MLCLPKKQDSYAEKQNCWPYHSIGTFQVWWYETIFSYSLIYIRTWLCMRSILLKSNLIMSSPSDPFSQARSSVWKKLTDKEKKELSGINTIEDVWKVTRDIQAEQAKSRTMGNMNKIRPYLEGLQRYGEVIGIFVQAKPEILSFIWVSGHYYIYDSRTVVC